MPRSDAKNRIRRLELLAVQLKQDEHCTVASLSAQFGVSTRTIARDLSIMREQGMVIDADRGRGGGVRLDRRWGVGRVNLAYTEAIDLLISIAVAERMNSPLFLANLGTVRRQLVASFSPSQRAKIESIQSRILVGETASPLVQGKAAAPTPLVVRHLHQCFVDRVTLEIKYRREDGTQSNRLIAPHYLLLKYPVWYVVAYDHLRDTARIFRCDRIISAMPTQQKFDLWPKQRFEPALLAGDLSISAAAP